MEALNAWMVNQKNSSVRLRVSIYKILDNNSMLGVNVVFQQPVKSDPIVLMMTPLF